MAAPKHDRIFGHFEIKVRDGPVKGHMAARTIEIIKQFVDEYVPEDGASSGTS